MTKSSRSGRSIEVVPVTADRWDDYDSFFAEHKPDCYCRWPRLAPMTFTPGDPTNRDAVCDRPNADQPPQGPLKKGSLSVG